MAQQKSTGKKTASSGKKSTYSGANTTRSNRKGSSKKKPYRRELGAVILLFLGIFSAIGYFSTDGKFINFFCDLIKGLTGVGYYLVPPALLFGAGILAFHRGKPVALRTTCVLLIPFAVGAFIQLIGTDIKYKLGWDMFPILWKNGMLLKSAGVLGGSVCVLFSYLFTKVGAGVIFIPSIIILLFVIFKLSPADIVASFKTRPRAEYNEDDYITPEPESPRSKKAQAPKVPEYTPDSRRSGKRQIDIPIDDEASPSQEQKPTAKKPSYFNKTPRVTTPEEFITGKRGTTHEDMPNTYEDETDVAEFIPDPDLLDPDIPDTDPLDDVLPDSEPIFAPEPIKTPKPAVHAPTPSAEYSSKAPAPTPVPEPAPISTPVPAKSASTRTDNVSGYKFPPLSLLKAGSGFSTDGREETALNKSRLETALSSFGINSTISTIIRGPSVTRYEMELEAGVKLNKITNLADDIALSLGASGVRIAAIPDKVATVGIEVPNKSISTVYLRDIIDTPEFANAKSKLTFAIGKNISGNAIVGNIAKLPHMLVAGTTGSGKSVCLNSLILSILYKARPDEVKFIMVDPKMVEFKIYNGIPHLLVPVVTDAKKAAGALQWAVTEMMKRYRLFSESNARDLPSYNKLMEESDEEENAPLPQIVVVIDELADLMMVAAKEVEESICRIAQMGRAAGVHLVIATQSPRADVITGLMKANIPSRIALKVSSSLESRIILDAGGNADKLVGNGDMLFAPIGTSKPLRIQGTWVSDEERESIIDFIKQSGEASYNEEVIRKIEEASEDKSQAAKNEPTAAADSEYDELLPQAVDVFLESGQASVSLLQRRLKLGYARAARIVDQMEDLKIVGNFEGSKPRQLLVTKAQWQEMQMIHGTAPMESPVSSSGSFAAQDMHSSDDLFN